MLVQVRPKVFSGNIAAGGVEAVVDQLRVSTLVALQSLGAMADAHAGAVWDALLKLSGAFTNTHLSLAPSCIDCPFIQLSTSENQGLARQCLTRSQSVMYAAGLVEVVEYTKTMDLQEDEGVLALGSIIVGLHRLLQHPQPTNQVGKASPLVIAVVIEQKSPPVVTSTSQ